VPRYLADSSIWGWARRRPDIQARLAQRFEQGELVTCAPVALEVLHRARTGREYDQLLGELFRPLDWLPLGAGVAMRAVAVQRGMARISHGNHHRPAIDYLVAAIAEAADAVRLWFFDRELGLICEFTGQAYESEKAIGR
jgi:predicted nucleic acid-binding protein